MSLLEVDGLNAGYGALPVLRGVSMTIEEDESIITVVGPNGAGKTTLLRTLSGLLDPYSGQITFDGHDIEDLDSHEIVDLGFVHVSEARNLFGRLTVYQNLQMGSYANRDAFEERIDEVYDMFPVLQERSDQKAKTLSGGEQQMLAIGRGLMSGPNLLALDEPSGALAPQLVDRVFQKIEAISTEIPVLLIEQHVDRALALAERAYLLENGSVMASGTGEELLDDDRLMDAYLRGSSVG